jgi:hypothetical protein
MIGAGVLLIMLQLPNEKESKKENKRQAKMT